jgi:hypothetical protein
MSDHANALRKITNAATSLGVTLPEPVEDAIAFDLGLPVLIPTRAETVATIADAFGTDEYADTVVQALDRLSRVESASNLVRDLEHRLHLWRWSVVVGNRDAVLQAFREAPAVVSALQVLNEHAPKIPANVDPTDTDGLAPDVYGALHYARQAAGVLEVAVRAVRPLHRAGLVPGFGADLASRAALLDVPGDLAHEDASALLRGLADRRRATTDGSIIDRPAAWFAVAASLGVRFEIASPEVA